MRKLFLALFLSSAVLFGQAFAEAPSFETIRPHALDVLRCELNHADPWVKVHAAEALLQMGYADGVEEMFRQELVLHGDQPGYRVGIRQVLARAVTSPHEQAELVGEIKAVFSDVDAPDRMHAAEALGKLRDELGGEYPGSLAQYTQNEQLRPVSKEQWLADGGREQAVLALGSENAADRKNACRLLGDFGSAEDRGLLLPLLDDADPDVRISAAKGLLVLERQKPQPMSFVDWMVLGGYFLGLILIGWYYARQTETAEDYLLGGRNMKSWMVGLSLFAALLSTASYMSVPGEIVKHGPMIMAQLVGLPIVSWLVGWFLIPTFMKLRVTSANEILEMNLGLSVRMLGSLFFLFARLGWLAMVIFITAKAVLIPILGLETSHLPWVCLLIGLITMAYTSTGGLKAAVLADTIQTFILFFGAILAILLITIRLKGIGWFPTEWAPTWDPPVFWFDTQARVTFMGAGMMMVLWYVCISGSDQVAVQRFLSTKNVKAARLAFNINLIALSLVLLFLGLLGFALYGYFQACPYELAAGMNLQTDADQIFPHFIVSGLPPGVSGLIVAGLMAAALSSLSAGLNSTCAVVTVDFLNRFSKKQLDEKHYVRRARIVSTAIGILIIGLSLLVSRVEGNFLEIINKIGNLLIAPLFTLFFMAIFVPWSNPVGTWAGAIVSVAMAVGVAFFSVFGLSFIWIIPCSLTSGVAVGCVASLLTGGKKRR